MTSGILHLRNKPLLIIPIPLLFMSFSLPAYAESENDVAAAFINAGVTAISAASTVGVAAINASRDVTDASINSATALGPPRLMRRQRWIFLMTSSKQRNLMP